jgi:hypothetical protein
MQTSSSAESPVRALGTSPLGVDPVALWRGLTRQGEVAFELGQDVRARQRYAEAMAQAEAVFDAALQGDEEAIRRAPPLYCISCNNIVTLARRQGDDETIGIFLYRAFARLLAVAESRSPLALRARCVLFLDSAATALTTHLELLGEAELARDHRARANLAIDRVQRMQQMAVA